MPNKVLFIRTDKTEILDEHLNAFEALVSIKSMDFITKDVTNVEELKEGLSETMCKYVILGGHGNEEGFGDNKNLSIGWSELGEIICQSGCINNVINSKIFLHCCKGGVINAACQFMNACEKLDFVVGAINEERSIDLLAAYMNLYHNIELATVKSDNEDALHRAQYSSGVLLQHYSREQYDAETKSFVCETCRKYEEENC